MKGPAKRMPFTFLVLPGSKVAEENSVCPILFYYGNILLKCTIVIFFSLSVCQVAMDDSSPVTMIAGARADGAGLRSQAPDTGGPKRWAEHGGWQQNHQHEIELDVHQTVRSSLHPYWLPFMSVNTINELRHAMSGPLGSRSPAVDANQVSGLGSLATPQRKIETMVANLVAAVKHAVVG